MERCNDSTNHGRFALKHQTLAATIHNPRITIHATICASLTTFNILFKNKDELARSSIVAATDPGPSAFGRSNLAIPSFLWYKNGMEIKLTAVFRKFPQGTLPLSRNYLTPIQKARRLKKLVKI
jgi:hypothetical protein